MSYELISHSIKFPPIGNSKAQSKNNLPDTTTQQRPTENSLVKLVNVQDSSNILANTDSFQASASFDDASVEEDWERQMKILEEVDVLTSKANAFLPDPLKTPLMGHIERYPGLKRVPIFKLFEDFQWKYESLSVILALFDAVTHETQLPMIDFLNSLSPSNLHFLALDLFHKIISIPALIFEFVVQISRDDGHYLIQIARHLPPFEFQVMADNILSLSSVQKMLDFFRHLENNRQTSKHCALCRQKRMYNLQYRMCNNQVPGDTLPIPGLLSQYDQSEVWAADDERHYSFDVSKTGGQIFWQKMPVNLVEICDKCLLEVNKAITNKGRHEPLYHLDAPALKQAMRDARDSEQHLAQIILLVAHERKLRRMREFGLSALRLQGQGLKKESETARLAAAERQRETEAEHQRLSRQRLNDAALAVDSKWKDIDRRQDLSFLQYRNRFALVQHHMGFDVDARPAPKDRQHATTWRRVDYDADGLPITAEAANVTFGMAGLTHGKDQQQSNDDDNDNNNNSNHNNNHNNSSPMQKNKNKNKSEDLLTAQEKPVMNIWKKIADEKHALFKAREQLKAEEQRQIAQQNLQTLKDYIHERLIVLDRQQAQMKALQEEEETRRQQQRVFDKAERKRQRFEAYLALERSHMVMEDVAAHAWRAYLEEIQRENVERENMFNAECDQREIDNFWGFEYYEKALAEEEKRLRRCYQARVVQLNVELQKMGCVQPIRKRGDREKLLVPVDVRPVGSLREEEAFVAQAQDAARRLFVIKKLKAEEIRSQLKYRLKFSYA